MSELLLLCVLWEEAIDCFSLCALAIINSVTICASLGSGRPGRDGKGPNQQVLENFNYLLAGRGFSMGPFVGLLSFLGQPESADFHLDTCQFGGLGTLR